MEVKPQIQIFFKSVYKSFKSTGGICLSDLDTGGWAGESDSLHADTLSQSPHQLRRAALDPEQVLLVPSGEILTQKICLHVSHYCQD